MRTRSLVMGVLIAAGAAVAPANSADESSLFAIPKVELRKEAVLDVGMMEETEIKEEQSAEVLEKEELSVRTEKAVLVSEISIQVYESMNGGPVLAQIEMPDEPGGAIGWLRSEVWDPVFAPEVVKVGKVQMSGGIVTAIKRKNPFGLLHPLVFVASW